MRTRHTLARLSVIASMLILAACEPDFLLQDPHMTFSARWGDEEPGTKTVLHSDGVSIYWTGEESINIFQKNLSGKFTATVDEPSEYASFEGELTETTSASTTSSAYWAVYPYSEDNSFDGESVTITVPNKQSAREGSFATKLFPAIARTYGTDLSFYNVCGGVCFTVLSSNVGSVVFKSNNGESLSGKIRVGFDENGLPVIKELINGSDELTISGNFEPMKRYYAVFLPRTLQGGITVTVNHSKTYNSGQSFAINKPITVNRSRFGQLDQIDVRTIDGVSFALIGLENSLLGSYLSRQNISGYTGLQVAMDCLGEDLVFPAAGNGWYTNTGEVKWTGTRDPESYLPYYPWFLGYNWINDANRVLSALKRFNEPQETIKTIKSQALFYRANSYFWLVQLYSDRYVNGEANSQYAPPLILEAEGTPKPLSTVNEMYSQIIADLEESISLLQENPNPSLNIDTYTDVTLATALGVRARVALAMQDWENARNYAQQAIKESTSSLMSQTEYCDGFNTNSNPEWMWSYSMTADRTLYFYGFMAYMSWNFNSSNIRSAPKCINSKLYDMIPDTDVRKGLFDPTGNAWTMPTTSFKKFPYMNRKFAVRDYTSSVADANFMRLGEMYLIAAEAAAMIGNDAEAQQYLYELNKTRDDGYQKSTKTGADLLEEIYIYRRIELWGEGHRFLDLKRMNLPLDRIGANHVESVSGVMEVPVGDIRWRFCIPQEAIDENPLIPANINE